MIYIKQKINIYWLAINQFLSLSIYKKKTPFNTKSEFKNKISNIEIKKIILLTICSKFIRIINIQISNKDKIFLIEFNI